MNTDKTTSRFAPALLWAGFLLTAVWAVAVRVMLFQGARPFFVRPFAFGAGLVAANVLTVWLSMKVARDFAPGSALRRAWRMMAWAGAFGALRYGAMWFAGLRGLGLDSGRPSPIVPGAQVAALISVVLLLGALVTMRAPFARLGLGRLRWADWAAVGVLAATVPVMYLLRESARVTSYRLPLLLAVQQFDPVLIAGCAIAGVLLLRIGRDLEGGPLAISFRYVMLFGIVRLLALLVVLFPIGAMAAPFTAAGLASDWLITMAVFCRWRLTVEAREYREG